MPKSQTVTSRNKKASDGQTSKASHLTVVPTSHRNTAMNNSTASNLNSQIDEAYNVASNALDCVALAMEHIGGLDALFKSIFLQTKDKQGLKEVLNASKLGCYVCDDFINSLDCQKEDLEKAIKSLLIKGGYAHE